MFKFSSLKVPIIQAPMAGVTTPLLVAEVANAGACHHFKSIMINLIHYHHHYHYHHHHSSLF